MATVTVNKKVVETILDVTLELSVEEAQCLANILMAVGGHDKLSPRKYVQSILNALRSEGIEKNPDWNFDKSKCSLWFENN